MDLIGNYPFLNVIVCLFFFNHKFNSMERVFLFLSPCSNITNWIYKPICNQVIKKVNVLTETTERTVTVAWLLVIQILEGGLAPQSPVLSLPKYRTPLLGVNIE